ncbi:MAG: superinfection immunity protein [Acidithiobacillus sp.]
MSISTTIALLDLLLGWTVFGWIATLIWAIASGNEGTFVEDGPTRHKPSL